MAKLLNRARMTVASAPGTGTITLGSAVTSRQSFAAAGIADGDIVSYVAEGGYSSGVPSVWEIGIGTYTASGTTLARTTIYSSSSGGSAVTLPADTQVFVAPNAADFGAWGGVTVDLSTGAGSYTVAGIPSDRKWVDIAFSGVSLSGTGTVRLQLGTGGSLISSGYDVLTTDSSATSTASSYIAATLAGNAAYTCRGVIRLIRVGTSNTYSVIGAVFYGTVAMYIIAGSVSLGGTLDRVALYASAGTFDAGSMTVIGG